MNGVRVGFSLGGAQTGLFSTPIRLYDTMTTGGAITSGTTRTFTIPINTAPAGTTGLILDISTTNAVAAGQLYVSGFAQPPKPTLNYPASLLAISEHTIPISTNRVLNITATQTTHVAIDLVGTTA